MSVFLLFRIIVISSVGCKLHKRPISSVSTSSHLSLSIFLSLILENLQCQFFFSLATSSKHDTIVLPCNFFFRFIPFIYRVCVLSVLIAFNYMQQMNLISNLYEFRNRNGNNIENPFVVWNMDGMDRKTKIKKNQMTFTTE